MYYKYKLGYIMTQEILAGYEVSKMNAVRHGILSKETILPYENQSEYQNLLQTLITQHNPSNLTEEYLVEELVGIIWRKKRLKLAENATFKKFLSLGIRYDNEDAIKFGLVTESKHRNSYKYSITNALTNTEEENINDLQELEACLETETKILENIKQSDNFNSAINHLDAQMLEYWEYYLKQNSSRKKDLETLIKFIQEQFIEERRNLIEEINARPLIRTQAIGLALMPNDSYEKLHRYETYLDRKFEKTLAMLIRLKESQNPNQFKDDSKAIDV